MVDHPNARRSSPDRRGPTQRVLLALEGAVRRAAVAQALVDRGAGVIEVEDGLDLLEVLGAQLGGGDQRWYPDLLIIDARLPLLDGVDALGLVRTFDRRVAAVLVVADEDEDARQEAQHLGADALERSGDPVDLAERALCVRRPPTGHTSRAMV
jgi:CheY-like chemotaxis protein